MEYENISVEKFKNSIKKGPYYSQIKKAIEYSDKIIDQKQFQNSLNSAYILNSLGIKGNPLAATFLCETKTKKEEITKEFNEDITNIVEELRKIKKIESQSKNFSSETLSKIILATTKDIRTIIIALSLKLSELRNVKEPDKILAKKIREVYLPISQKLGLNEIKWELEDRAFKIEHPKEYNKLKRALKKKRKERETDLKKIINEIKKRFKDDKINAKIIGRTKNFFGIYSKMKKKNCKANELHDLIAVRILCNTIKECYLILGIIHSMYEPLLNSFDDYIATPKKNNYRSIHTDLKTKDKKIFETQIRTFEMNAEAEEGLPAHWAYKEVKKDKEFDSKLTWAKELIEWHRKNKTKKILDTLKLRFEEKKIFTLTPKADIIELTPDSTPLDFAYAVHSNMGNKCEKAKVNGKIVKLDHKLENGDLVEIITSKKQFPKRQWLVMVKTKKAKAKIKQILKISQEVKPKIIKPEISKKIIESIKIAKCCNPLPENKIFAIKTTKRKLIVHNENCVNLKRENRKKIIPINWKMIGQKELNTKIKIQAKEKVNLLTEILDAVTSLKGKIISTNAKVENKTVNCTITLKTKKPQTIGKILEKINKIEGIKEVSRI